MVALVDFKNLGIVLTELKQRLLAERFDFLQPVIEVVVFQDQRQVVTVIEEPAGREALEVMACETLSESLTGTGTCGRTSQGAV